MLRHRNIAVFSDDWGRHPSSCQHLIKQLLPHNQVLWVNTIGMRSPQFSASDVKRSLEIMRGWLKKSDKLAGKALPDNLTIISPVMIPYNNVPGVRTLNRYLVKKALGRVVVEKGMKDLVVMTTFPCTCDYVGDLQESLYVYYCVDDFVNWPGVNLHLIKSMEEKLLDRCDLVMATAEELGKAKTRGTKPVHLLLHGVDFSRFNVTVDRSLIPQAMKGIASPIIGFFGALSSWLDFDLLASIAKERPDWSFVFIGPVDTDISSIRTIPNVHLVGRVDYELLPLYAACFDVGIIPFKVNELTKSVNPLKLLEYLSVGIPVVSTFMPEVLKYSDVVRIAHDKQEFLQALNQSLQDTSQERRQARIEKARAHSWQSVAEHFSQLIVEAEQAKSALQPIGPVV